NAIKFERFVFDILPAARNALVVETDRAEEFCPLKNQSGEFSPEYVRTALQDLHRRWLEQAGTRVAPGVRVEISPLRALDPQDLQSDPNRPEVIDTDTFRGPEGP
ncbi:MAG: UDPGP type 1 family protein, partial [Planctomycetaceae bacterium]